MSTREHSDRRYYCGGVGWRRSEASGCEQRLALRRSFTPKEQVVSGFQMHVVDVGCGVAHLEERTRVGGQVGACPPTRSPFPERVRSKMCRARNVVDVVSGCGARTVLRGEGCWMLSSARKRHPQSAPSEGRLSGFEIRYDAL